MENFFVLDLVDQDHLDEIKKSGVQITNGECLMESLNDLNLRTRIHNLMNRNVAYIIQIQKISAYCGPCLSFDFISDDNSDLELDQSDIKEICEVFGKVLFIDHNGSQSMLVLFDNAVDCFFAQRILNGHYIMELNLQLIVRWGSLGEVQELLKKIQHKQHNDGSILQFMELEGERKDEYNYHQKSYTNQQIPKFTCRYEIQIENDHDFQVARKIIGSKGCNMKKILDQCCDKQSQVVKLRLRGQGSGYKEGPTKQESNEQLHLCVSSKFNSQFQKACSLVEQLLQKIFEEYKHQYLTIGRKAKTVFFRKLSNVNKPTVYYEYPPQQQKVDKLKMR